MNKDILTGKWKELKGKARSQWGKLTDDDVEKIAGSYDELVGSLQKRYGYEKDRASKEVNEFLDGMKQ